MMTTFRERDNADDVRPAEKCGVCGERFRTRPINPADVVPELAAELVATTCCGWHCALQLCLSVVPSTRVDQRAIVLQRFTPHTT